MSDPVVGNGSDIFRYFDDILALGSVELLAFDDELLKLPAGGLFLSSVCVWVFDVVVQQREREREKRRNLGLCGGRELACTK